jgi:biotin synthase
MTPSIAMKTPAAAWTAAQIEDLFALPLADLIFRAQQVHRAHFDPNAVQLSTLLSIKTGGCSEDCGYCAQSTRHHASIEADGLLSADEVEERARQAKANGASRFCMGAAWRGPKPRDLEAVTDMVRRVKALGLETCATLGLLKEGQAERLREAGLDYYNHNLDTASDFYGEIITTHTHQARLDTLQKVRAAGMKVCCGGIVGLGESRRQRAVLLAELANLDPAPESVPINQLVPIPGTPLEGAEPLDGFEFVRTIACARIAMPASYVRLSAGRESMSDELQALCFLAGANSIFYGERLLTASNPEADRDRRLFDRLGIVPA